jgi:hypothetical protein
MPEDFGSFPPARYLVPLPVSIIGECEKGLQHNNDSDEDEDKHGRHLNSAQWRRIPTPQLVHYCLMLKTLSRSGCANRREPIGARRAFAVIHVYLARASNVSFSTSVIEFAGRERRFAIRMPDLAKTVNTDAFECPVTVPAVAESEPDDVIHGCHQLIGWCPSERPWCRPEINSRGASWMKNGELKGTCFPPTETARPKCSVPGYEIVPSK